MYFVDPKLGHNTVVALEREKKINNTIVARALKSICVQKISREDLQWKIEGFVAALFLSSAL